MGPRLGLDYTNISSHVPTGLSIQKEGLINKVSLFIPGEVPIHLVGYLLPVQSDFLLIVYFLFFLSLQFPA